jgi:hypothetical protein
MCGGSLQFTAILTISSLGDTPRVLMWYCKIDHILYGYIPRLELRKPTKQHQFGTNIQGKPPLDDQGKNRPNYKKTAAHNSIT